MSEQQQQQHHQSSITPTMNATTTNTGIDPESAQFLASMSSVIEKIQANPTQDPFDIVQQAMPMDDATLAMMTGIRQQFACAQSTQDYKNISNRLMEDMTSQLPESDERVAQVNAIKNAVNTFAEGSDEKVWQNSEALQRMAESLKVQCPSVPFHKLVQQLKSCDTLADLHAVVDLTHENNPTRQRVVDTYDMVEGNNTSHGAFDDRLYSDRGLNGTEYLSEMIAAVSANSRPMATSSSNNNGDGNVSRHITPSVSSTTENPVRRQVVYDFYDPVVD